MRISSRIFLFCLIFACLGAYLYSNQVASPEKDKIVIKDTLSRTISIPAKVSRILSLQPEITRIIIALGGGERLIGIDYFLRHYDHLFKIIFPAGKRLPVISKPDDSVNRELVVRLNPDVIFASPSEFQVAESLQRNLGIPVVAVSSMGRFEKLIEEINLVGRAIGMERRASEVISYFNEKMSVLQKAVFVVPPEKRPRIYLSFWGLLTRTPVFYEPVNAAGGINLAEGLLPSFAGTLGTVVSVEQIIKWNPDLILIQGNYLPQKRRVTVDGLLRDGRLASVTAIKNKRVFYTFGFWYWWDPAEVLIETLYLAHVFYPEVLGTLDLEKEGNLIFKKFYGAENAFTSLSKVLKCHDWTNTQKN